MERAPAGQGSLGLSLRVDGAFRAAGLCVSTTRGIGGSGVVAHLARDCPSAGVLTSPLASAI